MEISDLDLQIDEIIPPLSRGQTYAVKVRALFVIQDGVRKRVAPPIIGELWGLTESDARKKMTDTVEEWVAKQP